MQAIEEVVHEYPDILVGGEWFPPQSGDRSELINPTTGKVWATAPMGGEADIDGAVAAARHAFQSNEWRDMAASDRGRLLYALARLVDDQREHLARLESQSNGLPIRDSRGDIDFAVRSLEFYAGLADKLDGAVKPATPDWHVFTVREPVGVVAAITPWNAPLLMYSWKLGPALAAGCTVVLKPAEQTPVTALEFGRLAQEAGFPAGVVNVVPGHGESAGARLVENPQVDKISFTGEHITGITIARSAAQNFKHLTLECGGKAPHIVFADADLDPAVKAVSGAAFRRAGQVCNAGSRVFVESSCYDEVVDRIVERANSVVVGDALDERTRMGPLAFEHHLEKVLSYVEIGKQEGAQLVAGGGQPKAAQELGGYFVQPTVFAGVENEMRLAQEEIFGPVLSVLRFEDEEEVVAKANDVRYGLTAGLWTTDVSRAHRVARRLQAGAIWINVYPASHWTVPQGGYKMSGYGRENGHEAILDYTQNKSVTINLAPQNVFDPLA